MGRTLIVIAYPPPRRWWQFWIPTQPVVLRNQQEYRIDDDGVTVHRPRRGWSYQIAVVMGA